MWILKLHIAISILLCLYMIGLRIISKKKLKMNFERLAGQKINKGITLSKNIANIKIIFIMFCPFINLIMTITVTIMAFASNSDIDKMKKEYKRREELEKNEHESSN